VKRLACAFLVLVACHHTRKTLVPEVPQNGDAHARSRFLDAKAKFLKDGTQGPEFARIVEDYPQDPITPWAELYAGIAAVKARDFAHADPQLQKVIEANRDPGLVVRAQLFLGIAKNYEGDPRRARELLAHSDTAVENDDERTEYVAAVAYATAASEQPLASLRWFDELWKRVQPAERAVILARVEDVVGAAPPEGLHRAFGDLSDHQGPSFAVAGSRLAVIAEAAGDHAGSAKLREEVAGARAAVGLPRAIAESEASPAGGGGGDPSLLGAVLPLGTGIGEHATAGLALAAGAPDGKGIVAVETRAAADKGAAAEQVEALARANVIAIVGPIGDGSVDSAAGRAESLGVPMLSLSPHAEQRPPGHFVFHVKHSPEARARELARRALALGVKRFAVMHPESEYGTTTSAAFVAAVEQGGGKIVSTTTYKKETTNFAPVAKKLSGEFEAVFVADEAEKLGLLAPAIAASGFQPKPFGTKKTKKLNPVLLLSTVEDLKAAYLAAAGRHSEGALFAPGFYPDDSDPASKTFIERFTAAFGHSPGATEAYAYDAAQLAASGGASGRASLVQALEKGTLGGVTGTIRFDSAHRRVDPGVVYTVVEETGGAFAIRVAR
jgi:ABC-type branched-subunit amino acid transport system substrate-binding protein